MKVTKVRDHVDLVEVVEWIAVQWAREKMGLPNEWRQHHWLNYEQVNDHCATTACAAGRTVLAAGYEPALVKTSLDIPGRPTYMGRPKTYVDGGYVVKPGDDPHDRSNWIEVSVKARELLGLQDFEAGELFESTLDIEQILNRARRILERRAMKDETA